MAQVLSCLAAVQLMQQAKRLESAPVTHSSQSEVFAAVQVMQQAIGDEVCSRLAMIHDSRTHLLTIWSWQAGLCEGPKRSCETLEKALPCRPLAGMSHSRAVHMGTQNHLLCIRLSHQGLHTRTFTRGSALSLAHMHRQIAGKFGIFIIIIARMGPGSRLLYGGLLLLHQGVPCLQSSDHTHT